MRAFFKILNLLLCLELIVSPINPNLSLLVSDAFAQQTCPTGMNYDSTLNRCLTTADAAAVMNATASCPAGDVACYRSNAEAAFQKKIDSGEAPQKVEGNQFMSTVGNAAAVAGPLAVAIAASSKTMSSCASMSFYAMIAGSAAFIIGDNLANFQHKSRLEKIKEDWGKIVNPEQVAGDADKEREISLEAQSQSFEMLARAEDSLAKAAKMKKIFYMVAGLAYTASGVIAGLEIIAETADTTGLTRLANICPVTAGTVKVKQPNKSLFQYYSKAEEESFLEHKFISNLEQSKDLVSFLVNKKAMDEKNSSPSYEYYEKMKVAFSDPVVEDKELFKIFKDFSLVVLKNTILFPTAQAQTTTTTTTTSPVMSTTPATATPTATATDAQAGVDTNAAKAFKEDEAQGINWMGLGIGAVAGIAAGMFAKDYIKPMSRAIFSGVLAGMSFIMASHAGSQAEASKKRAELLRKMRDEFISASGAIYACKSEDRNDPAKPNCYCYTPDNQRNPSRGASDVCMKLWTGATLTAGNYTGLSTAPSTMICITSSNTADPACACKLNNTCMKVGVSGISGLNAGTMSMVSQSLAPLNQLASGAIDGASISDAALGNQAAKMNLLAKKLESSPKLKNLQANKKKATADLMARLNKASSQLGAGNLLAGSSSSGMPSNPGEAARMLEKEIASSQAATSVGGPGTQSVGSSEGAKTENFEFGLTGAQLAAQETQIAELMKQNLDYGGNDINQGSKANIFEVLSIRYQRSGMRRLFDEKGTTTADKPAKTEISR